MEARTTTCIPCVPSILEGFRRGGGRAGKGEGGGKGRGGVEEDSDDPDGMTTEAESRLLPSNNKTTKTTTVIRSGAESDVSTNAGLSINWPSLVSLSSGSGSPATSSRTYPLPKGKTSFGRSCQQDIIIDGSGVDDQHCYIINEGQVVTFYPLGVLNSLDGFRITKPTKLSHGSVLCFGHSLYFRFNQPPAEKVKSTQKIVIKGSSPNDENRRRLIKLQSKPGAQEVTEEKTNFPVPDASQFHWIDFNKELGLKQTSPHVESNWSNRSSRGTSQPVGDQTTSWTRPAPYQHPTYAAFSNPRAVRNSLPLSHRVDAPVKRSRFLSQGLETYPLASLEFESPTLPTFLPSQRFTHEPNLNARHSARFPLQHDVVSDKTDARPFDDESDSGTPSTETSSLSGSSRSSGVKVSLIERAYLKPQVTKGCGELHETSRKLTVLPIATSSGSLSAGNNSASSGYDNIANIKAAIIAAAAAKLSNCSKPLEIEGFRVARTTCSESKASGIPSQITSNCNVPLTSSLDAGFAEEASTDVNIQESPKEFPETSAETDINGVLETRPSNVSCSESDLPVFSPEPDDSSERCELQSQVVESLDIFIPVQAEESSTSKSGIFSAICSAGGIALTVLSSSNLNCIPGAIVGKSATDNSCVAQTDKTVEPHVPTVSKESQATSLIRKCDQSVNQKDLEAGYTPERKSNDSSTEFISPTENVKSDVVCLNKPPIGKPVQEICKPSKSERKSIKPEKKPSEPVASSLFKSLLSRSRSPSPKGRANRSPSPSSKDQTSELLKCSASLLHEAEKGNSPSDNLPKSFKQDGVHDKEKCSTDALTQRPVDVEHVGNSENLSQEAENDLLQNPWRVNLKHSLRPNLENFKGEKVFTKDTVTTNVVIGIGAPTGPNGSRSSNASVFASNAESLMKDFRATKTALGPTNLSDSAQDLRTVNSADQHVDIDFGYISDSGLSVTRGNSRPGKFTTLVRPKSKKSVTFAEEGRSESSDQKADSSQDATLAMSQNMDRVVEGRSPTEKMSENVRTYLEMVDSGWPKVRSHDDDLTTSNPTNCFTTNQNGGSDRAVDSAKKIGSKSSTGNDLFEMMPEFNNNSSLGAGSELPDNSAAGFSRPKLEERESMNLDDIDLEDLGASQQDLKELYQRRRAERMEEQQRAKVEKQRLEDILKMYSEFGLNVMSDRSQDHSDDRKLSVRSNLLDQCGVMITSSSSNSEDDAERGTIKRRPILDKSSLVCPSSTSTFDSASIFRLENNRLSDERDVAKGDLGIDDLSPASPVVDSGIDISTMDRQFASLHSSSSSSAREGKEFALLFGERRGSLEHQSSGERMRLEERRPSEECWSPRHLADETEFPSGKFSFNSRGLFQEMWHDEKLKHVQLDLLRELQRDVVQSIADIKQKIADIETRQSEAVREVEMERALLEGEQQIQMEQLDRIKEKIISLEKKEANLLAEAASQRAKEVEKICFEKEKLTELEKQMNFSRELASRTLKTEEAEMLKRRCLELQDTADTQRFLVDNLEFQQLEAEAHYEEEKEIIQNELKAEKDYLESLSSQHQATLKQIASQQSDLLKQVDLDVFELEKERHLLAEQFQKENTMLYNINRQIQEALPSPVSDDMALDEDVRPSRSNLWHRPRLMDTEVEVTGRSTFGSPRKVPTKFPHTIPKMDTLPRSRPVGEISDDEERRFLHEFKARSASRLMWDRSCDLADGGGGGTGAIVQWQGPVSTVNAAANSESEESSVSGSDPLSDKAISLSSKEDQLHDMECLLVLAKAEGLRMVEEQIHKRDIEREALELERRRRKELERRLAEEIAKHNDVIEQAIKLREKEKLQARPLTRYLPVRDRSLDLLQFIIAAGHSVDQCAHLAMTSVSCRGYLTKMGSRIRTWKKRWFVFDRTKRCLSYYGDKSESRPRGVIYFQAIEDVFVDHLHQVKSPTPQLTFCVKTFDRMYYLVAPSPDAMRIWIDVIFTGAEGYQQFA